MRVEMTIGKSFVVALINCDFTGMSKLDMKRLDEFFEIYPTCHVYLPEGEASFKRCKISKLMDDCYDCEVEIAG